jgi:hypothetical protein
VVVGGGSAGCVLAARLSEDPAQHVVLLEAGPDWRASEAPPQLRSLNGWRALDESACAAFQWRGLESRRTRAQETRPHVRGQGLGGGSTVNGMMAIRAVPDDYDRWAASGCPGWSYADMLPGSRPTTPTWNRRASARICGSSAAPPSTGCSSRRVVPRHVVAEVRVVEALHAYDVALDRDLATWSLGLEQKHSSRATGDVMAVSTFGLDVVCERPPGAPQRVQSPLRSALALGAAEPVLDIGRRRVPERNPEPDQRTHREAEVPVHEALVPDHLGDEQERTDE